MDVRYLGGGGAAFFCVCDCAVPGRDPAGGGGPAAGPVGGGPACVEAPAAGAYGLGAVACCGGAYGPLGGGLVCGVA